MQIDDHLKYLGPALFCILGAGAALADCTAPESPNAAAAAFAPPPAAPAPVLRPTPPECLQGLSGPEQENCSAEEIAAYAAQVDAYQGALQTYIADADRYAAEAVARANAAIAEAEAAQRYADGVFGYAECEAGAVRAQTE